MVEANVELPLRPLKLSAVHLEGHALRLVNFNWLEAGLEPAVFLNSRCMKVARWCFAERSADLGDVDVDDFLCVGIVDGTEVERIRVLSNSSVSLVSRCWGASHNLLELTSRQCSAGSTSTLVADEQKSPIFHQSQ